MRWLLTVASFSVASPLAAQSATAPALQTAPAAAAVQVVLTTSMGPVTIALEQDRAPATTANFLRYVDARRLDGIAFYRALKLEPGGGLVQAGQRDPRRFFPPVRHEPTSVTGLAHVDGAISMARVEPGSATADFFITIGAVPSLDAQPGGDSGFAVFGRVTEGMDVLRRILASPTSPTEGEGAMKGQMLAPQIRVVTVRRVP